MIVLPLFEQRGTEAHLLPPSELILLSALVLSMRSVCLATALGLRSLTEILHCMLISKSFSNIHPVEQLRTLTVIKLDYKMVSSTLSKGKLTISCEILAFHRLKTRIPS